MNNYIDGFKRYFDFASTSSTAEFWFFLLGNAIISMILAQVLPAIGGIFSLLTIIPSLAVSVRFLRGKGKSPWLVLTWLIPFVFLIIAIVLSLTGEKK